MISNGRLEITTQIGCRINCHYCPQKLLLERYKSIPRPSRMSLDSFRQCIDKTPRSVRIDFSGFCEPWQNPDCTQMLLYAAQRGHSLAVYSTLVGMHPADVEAIRGVDFEAFVIHLPDDVGYSNIPVTDEYCEVLRGVLELFAPQEKHTRVGASCHGGLHPGIAPLIPEGYFAVPSSQGINFRMIDRAGLLDHEGLTHRHLPGRIMCALCRRQLNHNVLLPDGSVSLCCMDYGLEFILGNLVENSYEELFKGPIYARIQHSLDDDSQESLCRHCHNVATWIPGYKMLRVEPSIPEESASLVRRFAQHLAQKSGAKAIAEFLPDEPIATDSNTLSNTLLFCPDGRAVLQDPTSLIALRTMTADGSVVFFNIPGLAVAENGSAFGEQLQAAGFFLDTAGLVTEESGKISWAAVLANPALAQPQLTPTNFRVIALIAAYNEVDVIKGVMQDLVNQGVGVYLIDNWSTDGTYEAADALADSGLVWRERFPVEGPAPDYNWTALLHRKEELARTLDANWFIHVDADEIRESPWPAVSLRDALYRVDHEGYNCIDHTVIDFRPVVANVPAGASLREAYQFFEFGTRPAHFQQIKGWKKLGLTVDIASTGGHIALFDGAHVYPYKFLLRHYPIRSQAQAKKKVFTDRLARWNPEEKARGWHTQYEKFSPNHRFVWRAEDLLVFGDRFYTDWFIERLTGIGVKERQDRIRFKKKDSTQISLMTRLANLLSKYFA